jgi:hypothetical protein
MALLNYSRGDRYVPATSVQVRSTASVVAILCAIGSFIMSGRGTESMGFILALVAIGAGLIGGFRALSPRVSGGLLSIIAVELGVIAFVYAFICMLV